MKKIVISWSSGKDSAYTLHKMMESNDYEVVGLFTTYSPEKLLVPIQATPIEHVRLQADAIELPLLEIKMPEGTSNLEYQQTLLQALNNWSVDFEAIAFGDLYCNGIVEFRQRVFADTNIECIFPLMTDASPEKSKDIADQIIQAGIQAILQSINLQHLDENFCGKPYDSVLLETFPDSVDPCGEVGEFHTFVHNAPFFKRRINLELLDQESQYYAHGTGMNMLVQKFSAT